jgi:hypothetical protein
MTHSRKSKERFRLGQVTKLQNINDQDLGLRQEMRFVMRQLNDRDLVSTKRKRKYTRNRSECLLITINSKWFRFSGCEMFASPFAEREILKYLDWLTVVPSGTCLECWEKIILLSASWLCDHFDCSRQFRELRISPRQLWGNFRLFSVAPLQASYVRHTDRKWLNSSIVSPIASRVATWKRF